MDLQVEVRGESDEIWCKDEKGKITEAQRNKRLPRASSLSFSLFLSTAFSLFGALSSEILFRFYKRNVVEPINRPLQKALEIENTHNSQSSTHLLYFTWSFSKYFINSIMFSCQQSSTDFSQK